MRKRNCRIEIYFTRSELETLTRKVRKSGLSREGYCRRVLNDSEVRQAPSADIPVLIRELRQIELSLDQLLKSRGLPDQTGVSRTMEELHRVERMIAQAYARED